MRIRRAKIRTTERGDIYYSYRLVRNECSGDRVRQHTLLNLGRDFPLERRHWPVLCARTQHQLERQGELVLLSCAQEVERDAQRIAAQLLNRAPPAAVERPDPQTVDVSSLELILPRSVGVEYVGGCGPWGSLAGGSAGAARLQRHATRAGHGHHHRAHGNTGLGARQLALAVRAFGAGRVAGCGLRADEHDAPLPDALLAQRAAIEADLFEQVADLFGLPQTVTLYDLTNTFFEGEAAAQPKAERGHSKEKCSDCPLLTLGLVLDGSGFVRRSDVFGDLCT